MPHSDLLDTDFDMGLGDPSPPCSLLATVCALLFTRTRQKPVVEKIK